MTNEKCFEYLRERHPKVWDRLMVLDEAVRFKFYNLLVEYLQKSALELDDFDLFSELRAAREGLFEGGHERKSYRFERAFGADDAALEQLVEQAVGGGVLGIARGDSRRYRPR